MGFRFGFGFGFGFGLGRPATPGLGVRVAAVAAPGLDERTAPALDGKEPHVRTPPAAGGLASGAESSPWASDCEA